MERITVSSQSVKVQVEEEYTDVGDINDLIENLQDAAQEYGELTSEDDDEDTEEDPNPTDVPH